MDDAMDVDDAETEAQREEWEDIEGENAGLYTLPPGEEGMLHSHAGGETIFQQIIDSVDSQYVLHSFSLYICRDLSIANEVICVHGRIGYKSASIRGASSYRC